MILCFMQFFLLLEDHLLTFCCTNTTHEEKSVSSLMDGEAAGLLTPSHRPQPLSGAHPPPSSSIITARDTFNGFNGFSGLRHRGRGFETFPWMKKLPEAQTCFPQQMFGFPEHSSSSSSFIIELSSWSLLQANLSSKNSRNFILKLITNKIK